MGLKMINTMLNIINTQIDITLEKMRKLLLQKVQTKRLNREGNGK